MAATLVELAADIVKAQASHARMSADDMAEAIGRLVEALGTARAIEEGAPIAAEESKPARRQRSVFRNHVICLECGRQMKQLGERHLAQHGLNKKGYKEKHGIPRAQKLVATALSERRRQAAEERGLGVKLAEARAAQKAAKAAKAPKAAKVAKAVKVAKAPEVV